MMKDIFDLTKTEMQKEMETIGEKPYRGKQIFSWLHEKQALSFDEMTDVSKKLRVLLNEHYSEEFLKTDTVQCSGLDGTRKYLFSLDDGGFIEGVFMEYRDWSTACISSQAGCAMGCSFCASTVNGLERSLTAGEMVSQVYLIGRDTGRKISNVVIMGSGEPLLNYENLMRFIEIITDPEGYALSQRSITVSTCGIVPGILKLAKEKRQGGHLQINLAISLHAATDEKRRKIMPVAEKYGIGELMQAARTYYLSTHRKITFEYALIGGVNDTDEDAVKLAEIIKEINVPHLVNLIPVNPVKERSFRRPDRGSLYNFKNKLENFGINGSIRRELGSDIDGACGQLRMRKVRAGT